MAKTKRMAGSNNKRKTYTGTSLGALVTQVGNHNAELCLVGWWVCTRSVVAGPGDQRLSNDSVAFGINNRDIGITPMRDPNPDVKVDNLANRVCLHICDIVVELVALAEPEITLGWVVWCGQPAGVCSQQGLGI